MSETIYASFADATLCEQAAGALLDYGVRREDVSLVSHDSHQPSAAKAPAATVVSPVAAPTGDTMGSPALAGQNTLGNNVAFSGDQLPTSQNDLVASGHAAANYGDAHAALADADYNREYRDQQGTMMPDTTATNVGRYGDAVAVDADRNATPATEFASKQDVVGYGATIVPGTGQHASMTDHEPIATIGHLSESGASPVAAAASAPALQRNSSATDAADYSSYKVNPDVEGSAKQGLSVTTAADAEAGAAKGATWGLGLGVLAGIAALAVPGVGWVIGGGALATAIGGLIGTTVAGAIAGGVTGYLKDQGVPQEAAASYGHSVQQGGAILAVNAPSGDVDAVTIQRILQKYRATNINAY